ncbi:hypothetical protein HYALB_00008293 [Hymenoscyphus albidus]|uniref:Uncharacterized protein n=1 Tax=Hymenoscyphus albidus TaxID=595503 RepID=A0A9N9LDB4_9HELO|nr:hypothetical protein HYALB_00008293 [Hymenoscyphus albidus]
MPGQSKSGHSSPNTAKPADPSMDSAETTPFTKGKRKKRDWITPGTLRSQLYPGEQPDSKKQKTSSLSTPITGAKSLSVSPGKITQPKEQKELPEENQSGQVESQSTYHRATKRKRTNTEVIYTSDDEGPSSVKRPRVTQNRSLSRKITNTKNDIGRPRQLKPFDKYHWATFGTPPPTFHPLYSNFLGYEEKDAEFAKIFDEEHNPLFRAPTPPAMSNTAIKPGDGFPPFLQTTP